MRAVGERGKVQMTMIIAVFIWKDEDEYLCDQAATARWGCGVSGTPESLSTLVVASSAQSASITDNTSTTHCAPTPLPFGRCLFDL